MTIHKKQLWGSGALLLAITVVCIFSYFLTTAPGNGNRVRIIDVANGAPLRQIAVILKQERLISSAPLFVLYGLARGDDARIKTGSYQLNDRMTPVEILAKLVAGEVFVRRFVVPEGYSIYQVADLLEQRGLFRKDSFLRHCFDPVLLKNLGVQGKSVEGYLYPSTYNLGPHEDEAGFIRDMVDQFNSVYNRKFEKLEKNQHMNRHEILTLASLIEKEAIVPAERPLIASVFINRLKQRIRLQSDPTAVYGIRAFPGKVTHRDVQVKTPYNTYWIDGLPPGPIGNPGAESIAAALQPARTRYLYFVARNDGTHFFSQNLDDHNRAVNRFLKSTDKERNKPLPGLRNEHQNLTGGR